MKNSIFLFIFACSFLCLHGQDQISRNLIKACKKNDSVLYERTLKEWSEQEVGWTDDFLSKNPMLKDVNDIMQNIYAICPEYTHQMEFHGSQIDSIDIITAYQDSLYSLKKKVYLLIPVKDIIRINASKTICIDSMSFYKQFKKSFKDSPFSVDSTEEDRKISEIKYSFFIDSVFHDNSIIKKIDTLFNVRPSIKTAKRKMLLMTEKRDNELNKFINSKKGVKYKGSEFIYSEIAISLAPDIDYMLFDLHREHCFVICNELFCSIILIYKKENNDWKINDVFVGNCK